MAKLSFFRTYDMNSPQDSNDMGLFNPTNLTESREAYFGGNSYAAILKSTPTAPFQFIKDNWGDWDIKSGTATSIQWVDLYFGQTVYSLTDASANLGSAGDEYDYGYDANGDGEKELFGMKAEQAGWLRGADIVSGSYENDTLNGYMGNDTIQAGDGNDVVAGGLGNDTLDGGNGSDIADFGDLAGNTGTYDFKITGNLGSGSVSFNTFNGSGKSIGQKDVLKNLEIFRGTAVADKIDLSGSRGYQDGVQSMLGNDTVIGGDVLTGTGNDGDFIDYRSFAAPNFKVVVDLSNTDTSVSTTFATSKLYLGNKLVETDLLKKIHGIVGTGGNDSVKGSAADDWFRGLAGNDTFTGGAGSDWIVYRNLKTALDITLATNGKQQTISAGMHGTDTIASVENIVGGLAADKIKGNDLSNILRGGEGNDTLDGSTGNDFADYRDATGSVKVVFSSDTSAKSSGADGEDTLLNIEGALGSSGYGDTLLGSSGNQTLNGRGGNDVLDGGLGNDTLIGGNGADLFVFSSVLSNTNIDTLTDFNRASADKLVLDDDVFNKLGITGTSTGVALSSNKFQLGTAANDSGDRLIYDQSTGKLYYDTDGSGKAAATQFATLIDKPTLTASDFLVIA